MEDRAGQQLGNYRLLRQLGTGGFAEVYLGEHVHLGTQAAIKVLHTRLSREDHEYFRNEARIVAHLIHPHIVRVLDFGIEDAVPFLVMDYAPGGTLRELHPRKSRVPLAGVRTYVAQIASALHYAHQHKIVHRDIKPENMLLNAEQEVVLSDFGIALISRSSRNQSLQDVVGTLAYMAPEQLRGKPCPASDQYALGIVIYEWLCGECPFHGTFIELCSQHMLVDPPSFAEKHLEMPSLIEQVVRTALAKDPVERFNSIEAFARAFEQASLHAAPQAFVPTINLNKPVPMQSTSDTERAVTSIQVAPSSIQRRIPTQPVTLPPFTSQSSPASLVRPLSATTRSPQYGLSRRTVLYGGLVGVGLAGLAGSALAAWWIASHTSTPLHPFVLHTHITISNIIYTYRGHTNFVISVAWSPEGERIASASDDLTVQVWDATTGAHPYTYRGHTEVLHGVAWSPDGERIASVSTDFTVQVWDATDGAHPYIYKNHEGAVNAVAWSPDGKHLASASKDQTVQVWDATTGANPYIYRGHTDSVNAVAWSPDGRRIASGSSDRTVQVWDATNSANPSYIYKDHEGAVNAVVWLVDGRRVASGSNDRTVQVWDAINSANPSYVYRGHEGAVNAVTHSPDGRRLASASDDQTVQVWSIP